MFSFFVRDEGVDSGSIIDGFMPWCECSAKWKPLNLNVASKMWVLSFYYDVTCVYTIHSLWFIHVVAAVGAA